MTTEERASKLLTDLEAVCNDYAGIEQDCKLKELFIDALADARRAALEIVEKLAKTDPVYGPIESRDKEDKRIFVRKCALCRAKSGHNEENVRHEHDCPWIPAMQLTEQERAIRQRRRDANDIT